MSALSQIQVPDGTTYEFKDAGALRAAAAAPEFSAFSSYAVGDAVTKDGLVYRCTSAHSGAWNSSHFAALDPIQAQLDALNAGHRYALGTTLTASATLADRTVNKVAPAANNSADITLSFPAAVSGRVRDFLVLVTNTTGNTGDIAFSPPSGATVLGDGFEDGVESGETRLYMVTEVESNTFYVKSVDPEGGGSSGGGGGLSGYTVTISGGSGAGDYAYLVKTDGTCYEPDPDDVQAVSLGASPISVPNVAMILRQASGSVYGKIAGLYILKASATLNDVFATCLVEGTRALLSDGSERPIEDIGFRDNIAVWDFENGCRTSANPLWVKIPQTADGFWRTRFASGRELLTCGPRGHRVFSVTAGIFLYAPDADGHDVRLADGSTDRIVCSEHVDEPRRFYNVITDGGYMNLYANGVLTSCRMSNYRRMDPESMRYIRKSEPCHDALDFAGLPEKYMTGLRLCEQAATVADLRQYVERLISLEKGE